MVFTLNDYVALTFAASNKYCLICKKEYRSSLNGFLCSTCEQHVRPDFEQYLRTQGLQPPARGSDAAASQNEPAPPPEHRESDVEVSDFEDDDDVLDRDHPQDYWEDLHGKCHTAMRKLAALFSCKFVPRQMFDDCAFYFVPDSVSYLPTRGKRSHVFNAGRKIMWLYGPHESGKNWFLEMLQSTIDAMPSTEAIFVNMPVDEKEMSMKRVVNLLNGTCCDQLKEHLAAGGTKDSFVTKTNFLLVAINITADDSDDLDKKRKGSTLKKKILRFAEEMQQKKLTSTMHSGAMLKAERVRLVIASNEPPIKKGEPFGSSIGTDRLMNSVYELRPDENDCVDLKVCVESNRLLAAVAAEKQAKANADAQQRRDARKREREDNGGDVDPLPQSNEDRIRWWMRRNNKVLDARAAKRNWMLYSDFCEICLAGAPDGLQMQGVAKSGNGRSGPPTLRMEAEKWFGVECVQTFGRKGTYRLAIVDAPPPAADPEVSPGEDGPDSAGPAASAGPSASAGPAASAGPSGLSETAV